MVSRTFAKIKAGRTPGMKNIHLVLKTTAKTEYVQACSTSDQGGDRDRSKYNNNINNSLSEDYCKDLSNNVGGFGSDNISAGQH